MINKRRIGAGWLTLALVAALLLAQPLLCTGCGGSQKQEPPPPAAAPTPPPAAKPAPVEKAAIAAPAPAPAEKAAPAAAGAPVTLGVLKLAPESAMVTLALPPVTGLLDKAVALAKRLAPPEVNVDEQVAKKIAEMAQDVGVPNAKSLAEIARAKGFNADAPLAIFVDPTPSAASAKTALAEMKTAMEAAKPAEPPKEAPKEGAPKEGAAAAPAPAAPKPPDLSKLAKNLKEPAIGVVLGCADAAAAEATVKDILNGVGAGYVDPSKVETVDVGGVPVKCYDPQKLAYAIVGDKLVASNSLAMLKEILARVGSPAAIRYGSPDCTAEAPDDVVALTRMDKIAPLVKELLPSIAAVQPKAGAMAPAQLDAINKILDAFAGDDPGVTTLTWTDKKVELGTRFDLSKHPAMAEMAGEAKPLRLAPMLPDNTLVMLTLRFNDKIKENFKNSWINALPPEIKKDTGVAQAMTYINQVVEMLGDELTIGVASAVGGFPQLILMAGLGNPQQTKDMIQMLAPMTPSEPHAGVDVSLLAVPAPLPIYISFPGDTVVISNDLERMKGIIDMIQAKSGSKLFASLDPPIDAAVPRYGALLIKSNLVSDVVVPLAGLAGGIPSEMMMPINKVVDVLREVRGSKDMKGNWVESRLTLLLK